MSVWILDTDHFSLFQRGHLLVRQRVNGVSPEQIATTIITAEEQLRGRLNNIRRADSADKLILAYTRLWDNLEDIKNINLLNFDQKAHDCYAELIRQRVRIGTRDLRIAATVISRNGTLVTRNRRDFERVPGLVFEDWSIA